MRNNIWQFAVHFCYMQGVNNINHVYCLRNFILISATHNFIILLFFFKFLWKIYNSWRFRDYFPLKFLFTSPKFIFITSKIFLGKPMKERHNSVEFHEKIAEFSHFSAFFTFLPDLSDFFCLFSCSIFLYLR